MLPGGVLLSVDYDVLGGFAVENRAFLADFQLVLVASLVQFSDFADVFVVENFYQRGFFDVAQSVVGVVEIRTAQGHCTVM